MRLGPAVLTMLAVGCSATEPEVTDWVYHQPEQVDDGWQTASLADVGMDHQQLTIMMEVLRQNPGHLVHGIVIAVGGKLVFEEYFSGRTHPIYGEEAPIQFGRETKHTLSSVAKSVTATLLGIAIERGFVSSVDEHVFNYFPDYSDLNVGRKRDMSLEHLVTMSAGFEWDESSFPDPRNDLTAWFRHDGDLIRFVLERPMVADPGTHFTYNGGATNILGEVIGRASGVRLDQFSDTYLFTPLGISDFSWYFMRPDFVYASGDVSLRPRDVAKLGQLYLQDGMWNGEQILSREWVQASTQPAFTVDEWDGHVGYSYGWWPKSPAYGNAALAAAGWGGQAIIVMPEFDMVAVFTGGSYWEAPLMSPHDMMLSFVLPAIGSGD